MFEDIGSDLRKILRLWRNIVDIENAQQKDVSPKSMLRKSCRSEKFNLGFLGIGTYPGSENLSFSLWDMEISDYEKIKNEKKFSFNFDPNFSNLSASATSIFFNFFESQSKIKIWAS